ncbi:metal-dependent hydrolase [Dethiobacter alkaliphilus]|uniref:metal-dependent hydrolase n=1 Tax=Dethiobacter alkaliphilus TaxID=427926 RepID=UPI00222619ED|nr:metal-dependent hydrolase [Dethiobacter alkaliphilus]MCW3488659.1 metal-dependent hydrolase [Dethiobacter alkaliphilus]
MTNVRFLGHACFQLEHNGKTYLFDPFITDNPQAPVKADEVQADYIFVSHAHADHLGDTFEIAKRTGATVISTFEIIQECEKEDVKGHPMHVGGKTKFEFGYVRVTPAFHGAGIAGGHACGFIINFGEFTVYFAGDTSLFGDMKLLGEIERINLFLVPIGGNFTMDIDDAVYATKFVGADSVIPFHYNTWPLIAADPLEFKNKVEKNTSSRCLVLNPGEDVQV